jgi:hypothetical protein
MWDDLSEKSVICSAMMQVQFQVIVRPMVCRPVRLGDGPLFNFFDNGNGRVIIQLQSLRNLQFVGMEVPVITNNPPNGCL